MTDARMNSEAERRRTPKRRALQRSILDATRRLLATMDADELTLENVAAEAGVDIGIVNEYFHGKNELFVALAAHELTGVARQMFSGHKDDPSVTAASSDALGLLRSAKMILGPSLEPEVAAAARHVAVTEHPDVGHELVVPPPDSDVAALVARVSALEKNHSVTIRDLNKTVGDIAARLQLVESLPPSPAALAQAHDQARQQAMIDDKADALIEEAQLMAIDAVDENREEPVLDAPPAEITLRENDTPHKGFLAAARRAAKDAAEHHHSLREKDSKYVKAARRSYLSVFGKRQGDRKRRRILATGTAVLAGSVAVLSFVMPAPRAPLAPVQSASVVPTLAEPATLLAINAPEMAQLVERAGAGDFDAETLLGLRYLNGESVAKDEGEAFYWFERAAKNGQPLAQYWLATLLARPGGAHSDPAQAIRWYEQAAKRGNRMAMNDLAVAYAQGDGTELDMRRAAYWFGQAARFGHAEAQFNLGVLYERGEGVQRNIVDAYKWYAVAARSGDKEAAVRIVVLGRIIDAANLRAAQATADAFTPEPVYPAANIEPKLPERGTG